MNSRIIVINGFARGGTNILWNILISHPQIVSSLGETQQVIRPKKVFNLLVKLFNKNILNNDFILSQVEKSVLSKINKVKYDNIHNLYDRYKYREQLYTKSEIEKTIVCIKGNNTDIFLNDIFKYVYTDVNYLGLMRNGYALCNGYLRRGWSIDTIAEQYKLYGEKMIEDSKKYESYKLIRFEDMIKDVFKQSEELYNYLNLEPVSLDYLKLMVKKTMNEEGERKETFGSYGEKHWFTKDTIGELINPSINKLQANKLSDVDRLFFEKKNKNILEYFGYLEN